MNTTQPTASSQLNQVKKTLRQRLTAEFQHLLPVAVIRRAMDDAEQLARETGFPALVFPALAEEKVRLVSAAITPGAFDLSSFQHAA